MRALLSGNEAVARGAYESGVRVAAAYPGTPSTEIIQEFSRYEGVYAEWAPNEKVAFEVGIGASLAGVRAMVAMKHVGLNVASDPFMTFAYTGVNRGFLLVCADDPGMHSSQNEQDNRYFARFAQVPLLEPSSSQEAKEMVREGLRLSERFDTPSMLRLTTRISHSKGIVRLGKVSDVRPGQFTRDLKKYVMIPGFARLRHPLVLKRIEKLRAYSNRTALNRIEWGDKRVGIVSSGVAYQYAREVMPDASFLKLGLTFPLPDTKIREFSSGVRRLLVVEELEPYLEEQILAMGIRVEGKRFFPRLDELSPEIVAEGLSNAGVLKRRPKKKAQAPTSAALPRPPVMCAGCPHRSLFYALNQMKGIVLSDIGCYTLSVLPPLQAIDSCICMGASISMAQGVAKAIERAGLKEERPVFAVIGDSTFLHSGVTGLMDVAYNNGNVNVIILDNRTTAMTGGQDHPGTGLTLQGDRTRQVDLRKLADALGIERVRVVDPYDLAGTLEVLREEASAEGPSLIITNRPCVMMERFDPSLVHSVDPELCEGCGMCLRLGCPAIVPGEEIPSRKGGKTRRKAVIDAALCRGCAACEQICKQGAIAKVAR
ncbi:MAG: indolepyruvate ferredoxin oxidoreductase subunit alpha [Thermodesulfobacteriota bacterium]